MSSNEKTGGYGVKYVTPNLIAKASGIDDIKQISTINELNLSFKHSDEQKIERLEHLDRCKKLKILTICSQSLTKMNGISKLSNLLELDLSGNKIQSIEGIKNLKLLQKMDLSFNQISSIPTTMTYLPRLQYLNISRNKLSNIRDVLNLRKCTNLNKLVLAKNPICSMDHYRQFVIFYLSQLGMFDSLSISQKEVIESRQRFERNEVDKLLNDLKGKDEEIANLQNEINDLREYKQESDETMKKMSDLIQAQKQSINEINTQLLTQQQLIQNKNESLIKTRNELSEMEEKYQNLQSSMKQIEAQNQLQYQQQQQQIEHNFDEDREEKEESERFGVEMQMNEMSNYDIPSKLKEACSSYLDSIQSVNEALCRYDALKQQYEATKDNMNVIRSQIEKSNKALSKLRERNNLRNSVENPFENDSHSRILSKPPVFNLDWQISPVLSQKSKPLQNENLNISEDSIKAKIDEAHRIEEQIAKIEHQLSTKQKKQRLGYSNMGSMGSMPTVSNKESDHESKKEELVNQFTNLIESMDAIEHSFSLQQKLSHSQDFDDLRIKLVKLYIKRYENEQMNVEQNVNRLEKETNNLERTLSDYVCNRDNLLLDIHRILRQFNSDCINLNEFNFIPQSYVDKLPESVQQKYENLCEEFEAIRMELEKERNVSDLLRHQIEQRQDLLPTNSGKLLQNNPKIVQNLIVRAETAENRVQELSFLAAKQQKTLDSGHHGGKFQYSDAENIQFSPSKKPSQQREAQYSPNSKPNSLQYELSEAKDKIKYLEQMIKNHESELVETLTQKLKEAESECVDLKSQMEEKLSWAKYIMSTKEQRLEAEKTINITLQREIDEMKEQSQLFLNNNAQQNNVFKHEAYTVPLSMNQSMDQQQQQQNKRMFISQPIMKNNDNGHMTVDDDEESVRMNIHDNFDDDDEDLTSVHSAQQNIVHLSQHLHDLRQKVQSEEDTIRELETKKNELSKECNECMDKLNQIQSDISVCKEKKKDIVYKLDEIENENKQNKDRMETQEIVNELMQKSQDYTNQLAKLEQDTTKLLKKRDNAQKELSGLMVQIEDKQQEYNQISKRVEVKQFELSGMDRSEIEENDHQSNENLNESAQSILEEQVPTKRDEQKQQNVADQNEVCNELDATLKQLNAIKNELRNHENYHKIIRLDAVQTEITERMKELKRLKNELNDARNGHRVLYEKIADTTQELKGMERQMNVKQNELKSKNSQIESVETKINKKNLDLASLNKAYDKKYKKLSKLNNKLSVAEQLLKDISNESNIAQNKLNSLQKDVFSKENALQCSMDLLRRSSTTHDAMKLFKVIEQIESEQKELNEIQINIQTANNELKSVQNEIKNHKAQISDIQSEKDEIKQSLKQQIKEKEAKDIAHNALLSKLNDLERNKRSLQREFESEQNNLNEIRQQVSAQNDELRKLKKEENETDKLLNDKTYKLMSVKDDLTETKNQLNALKTEYDRIKGKIRSKSKKTSPVKELYKIYKKDENERNAKLENYNARLIEMDKEVNDKKLALLQYQNDLDAVKDDIAESNKKYHLIKDESLKIERQTQINIGKLSIYQQEIENQQAALDKLYEKKRQKTVEMFKEKSSEIQEANNRLIELQAQVNAVSIELESKKAALNDLNDEKEANEKNLDRQMNEKCDLQTKLLELKQNLSEYESKINSKKFEVRNVEKQLDEMMENMNRMKTECTKRSDELLSDRTMELQAVQFQLDKARQEIVELNKANLDKQNQGIMLNQTLTNKENDILAKEQKMIEIESQIKSNNSELGQIDAKILLKKEELDRLKKLMANFVERSEHLRKENAEMIRDDIADIVQELDEKNAKLQKMNEKYVALQSEIKEKESMMNVIEETIKKRSDDYEKLENEIRENSFAALRIRSEQESELNNMSLIKEKYHSLNKELTPKQIEFEDLSNKLHKIKKDFSASKRDLENINLAKVKAEKELSEIQNGLNNLNLKKKELNALNEQIKEREIIFEQVNIKCENAQNELDLISSDIASSTTQHQTIATEIANIHKLREDANESLKATQKELQEKDQELERVKLDLSLQSDQLYTSKEQRLKVIMAELSKRSRDLNDNKKKMRSIKDLLAMKEKELKQITTSIQKEKTNLLNITSDHNDIQRKLKNKRNELRVVTMELGRKGKKSDFMGKNDGNYLTELDDAIATNKETLNDLDDAIFEKKKNLENIKMSIEQCQKDFETLKNENSYLNEQKLTKLEQINDLTQDIAAKQQELDRATLEIELKSKEIDNDISIKMKEILNNIKLKEQHLMQLNDDCKQKNIRLNAINENIQNNQQKLALLQSEIKTMKDLKASDDDKLGLLKQSICSFDGTLLTKQSELDEIEQKMELKLQQLKQLNAEFDEQSQQIRKSRNNLQRVNVDLDEKNNELQDIVQRINNAKEQIDDAQNSQNQTQTPTNANTMASSLNFADSINFSMLSHISTPEQGRAFNNGSNSILDVSLEEINNNTQMIKKHGKSVINVANNDNNSPQNVINTVEKLRRTIDAMCYPRGGCIFSLSSCIQHYDSALKSLEEKRTNLVAIIQSKNGDESVFELDSDDEQKKESEPLRSSVTSMQQSQAVNELGAIWEELQSVKKVINKLFLERQHMETTLNHALSIIADKKKVTSTKGMSKLFASTSTFASFASTIKPKNVNVNVNGVKVQIENVIKSIDESSNEWNDKLNSMDDKLCGFELQMSKIKQNKNEIEMGLKLKNLENIIFEKEQQLKSMDEQLESQRILLEQLKQQSDAMANTMSNGQHFQLSNSPTMARQIANKLRMEKQLNDLKEELSSKKEELSFISQQLTQQCQRQNSLISSFESNQGNVLKERIAEIQKLYKMREKNLKTRIDSYKKELQKRDKELNNINSMLSSSKNKRTSTTKIKKEIIRELRTLQIERSKSLNRRDLKNQIKERDEQIAFLVNHFGSNEEERNEVEQSIDARLYSSHSSRSQALSQIDANLTDALAPFQSSLTPRKQNKISKSAYHFVPATSDSSENNKNDSMLQSIFGNANPLESDLYGQKKKKKKNRSRYEEAEEEEDDNDDQYESLSSKYG